MSLNANAQFFIQQELRKAESNAQSASRRIRLASTLRQVSDLMNVTLSPYLRPMKSQIPGLRALNRAAADRAEELVQEHLQQLKALAQTADKSGFEAKRRQLQHGDWMFLRGELSQVLSKAMREADRLAATLAKSAGTDAP